jgi:hypothetical protein
MSSPVDGLVMIDFTPIGNVRISALPAEEDVRVARRLVSCHRRRMITAKGPKFGCGMAQYGAAFAAGCRRAHRRVMLACYGSFAGALGQGRPIEPIAVCVALIFSIAAVDGAGRIARLLRITLAALRAQRIQAARTGPTSCGRGEVPHAGYRVNHPIRRRVVPAS